jgi:hypothetical protein
MTSSNAFHFWLRIVVLALMCERGKFAGVSHRL